MKKDVWGNSFNNDAKENIKGFTSIYGFMPFSEEGFKVTTQWINEKDKKILEAGCGTGRYCIELAKKYNKSKIVGVDISPGALNMAKMGAKYIKNKNISFKKGDIFKLPFKDNSFDVVFNKGVIEHFYNYQKIIDEMTRVTKKSGKVIIAVPNKYNIIHPIVYFIQKNILKTYPYGMEMMFTPKRLKNGFISSGLINLEQDGLNTFYRLAKLFKSKNILLVGTQYFFRLIAIILHYLITKPLDFLFKHQFSRHFGWEIVVKGEKSKGIFYRK